MHDAYVVVILRVNRMVQPVWKGAIFAEVLRLFLKNKQSTTMKYCIETRYQWRSREGLTWTKWFSNSSNTFDSIEEAKSVIKTQPKEINKLKYEYRVVEIMPQ